MKNKLSPLFLACLAFYSSHSAFAQDIENMTVEGTHIENSVLMGAIPSITINKETIDALATNSIADVLRGEAGIDISQQGGAGGLTFLSIRGGDPNFVVILIDGVKVNDPTNSRGGAFDLASIDPALVESIQVFYGGFSSVYGTDALSGVVSIKTKGFQPGEIGQASLTVSADQSIGASVKLAIPVLDVAELSVSASLEDGDDSTFSDEFKRKQLITSIQSYANSDTQWQIGGFYSQGESASFPEDSGGDRLSVIRTPETKEFTQNNLKADIQQKIDNKFNVNFSAAWAQREEDISNPGIATGVLDGVSAIDSNSNYDRFDVSAVGHYKASDIVDLALGIAWSDEEGEMQSIIDFGAPVPADYVLDRQTRAVFAEAAVNPNDQLNILLGARHDKTNKLQANTHKIIVSYQLNPAVSLSSHISKGFKLPSFFALAHPFVGNSELKPEESENIEVSLQSKVFTDGELRLSAYQNTYSNLVDFDPIAFINVNRSKVRAKGIEAQLKLPLSEKINLATQITHTKIDTFEQDVTLRRRPEWKGSITLTYRPTELFSLTSRFVVNEGYYDSSIPTGMIELEGFNQLDVSARWAVNDKTSIRINMQNTFDSDHEEGVGFENPGRQASLNISRKF
ncbi:TonB-dependent receptor plug domain-containing protein [Pseudocolwellia agarivorans]|uniref:TonB-dependent receptor plug domain-containing protein n=1 Tax=Pseudocolwellia agarivorans TaxID=1911682 RepID=UPI003F8843F0